jgi:hypothetical protein
LFPSEDFPSMATNTLHMRTPATEISVVSTVDEHGLPVDVAVVGSPDEVRSALAARGAAWVRFATPEGHRIYLHPRQSAEVVSAGLISRSAA